MRLVIVESPYAGDIAENEAYARAAMRDCLDRGEAPYASHLLYTQPGVLDELAVAAERTKGIEAGLAWGKRAAATVVYVNLGISGGMKQGMGRAVREGRPVEYRSLPGWPRERQRSALRDVRAGFGAAVVVGVFGLVGSIEQVFSV